MSSTIEKAVTVRGRLSDPRHIELDEAVTELVGNVDVVLRPIPAARLLDTPDVFAMIASLPGGTRSQADIDAQVHQERASWDGP